MIENMWEKRNKQIKTNKVLKMQIKIELEMTKVSEEDMSKAEIV